MDDPTITASHTEPVIEPSEYHDYALVLQGGDGEPNLTIEGSKAELMVLIDQMHSLLRTVEW